MNTLSVMPPWDAIRLLVLTMAGLLLPFAVPPLLLALLLGPPALDMLNLNGRPTMNDLLMLIVLLERIRSTRSTPVLSMLVSVPWPVSMRLGPLLDPLLRPKRVKLFLSALLSCAAQMIPTLGVSTTGTAMGTGPLPPLAGLTVPELRTVLLHRASSTLRPLPAP